MQYEKRILHALLDSYESSSLSRGENKVSVHIVYPITRKTMPTYFDESSLAYEDIHAAVKHLEELGYVQAVWKGKKENHILQKVILCEDKAEEVYRYIGRMPKIEQQQLQLGALEQLTEECQTPAASAFIGWLMERLQQGKTVKEYLDLDTPMTKDRQILNQNYEKAAKRIIEELEKGKDVAYLTLGDPTIYSTYMYIQRIIKEKGYETSIINGIPSFCAAASKLNESLADRADELHVIPSSYDIRNALRYPGTKVLMKSASRLVEVREILKEKNVDVKMIENCGMADEQIYERLEDIPEHASYYSLLIVKESV